MLKLMEANKLGLKPGFGESEFPQFFNIGSQLGRQKHLHYVIVFLVKLSWGRNLITKAVPIINYPLGDV